MNKICKRIALFVAALVIATLNIAPVWQAGAVGQVNVNWTGASTDGRVDVTEGVNSATIIIGTLWIEIVDSLEINGTPYNTFPVGKAELLSHYNSQEIVFDTEVPVANNYNITIHTHEIQPDEVFIGNFLWENDENSPTAMPDDIIGHGTISFVKAVYNNTTYNSVAEVNAAGNGFSWDDSVVFSPTTGSATFPTDTVLTVKLIPEAGYQLVSFGINGGQFEPQANIGEYTFTIRGGNGHLAANFAPVDDAVDAQSRAIASGSITLGGEESSMEAGTAKLEVIDANIDADSVNNFTAAANGYTITNYLDISLYNTIYKGSADDAWDTEVTELDNEATITLQLEEGINGNEVVIVHERHDGTYEIIPSAYDPVTHTITFKTSSFSNYAIATRTVAKPNSGIFTGEGTNANSSALEALAIISALTFTAWFIYRKWAESSKTESSEETEN